MSDIINLNSPYSEMEQYTRIQVQPCHMNKDILQHILDALRKKVEDKCNKNGFVLKVHKIVKYEEKIMLPENLSGAAPYNITYNCRICIPLENLIIIGMIKVINSELLICFNGPIIIFIPTKTNIDPNIWDISNEFTQLYQNLTK